MGNKIWLSRHPTNFGCEKIVCPYVHPIHVSECELSHLLTWESKVNVVFNFLFQFIFVFPLFQIH